jgi:phage uncharacterized protein TIGR01671|nr:MAG TPA: YopX protein [Caudoviricetes sp.]
MCVLNYRAFVDNKMYKMVSWMGDFITLSRKNESKYVQSINVKREDIFIMQSSGLKDRKGNEIFHGDIVKNSDKDIGIVRFKDGAFEVDFKEYIPVLLGLINDDLEIIGDIHRNKKLLDKIIDKNKKVVCMNKVEKGLSRKRKRTPKKDVQ